MAKKKGVYKTYCKAGHNRTLLGALYGRSCKLCRNEQDLLRKKAFVSNGFCFSGDGNALYRGKRCKEHFIKEKHRSAEALKNSRETILEHYGKRCFCCGNNEYWTLQIDHINKDGNIQRRNCKALSFYHYVIRKNFPVDLQILCANCNWGKKVNNGVCPHLQQEAA